MTSRGDLPPPTRVHREISYRRTSGIFSGARAGRLVCDWRQDDRGRPGALYAQGHRAIVARLRKCVGRVWLFILPRGAFKKTKSKRKQNKHVIQISVRRGFNNSFYTFLVSVRLTCQHTPTLSWRQILSFPSQSDGFVTPKLCENGSKRPHVAWKR